MKSKLEYVLLTTQENEKIPCIVMVDGTEVINGITGERIRVKGTVKQTSTYETSFKENITFQEYSRLISGEEVSLSAESCVSEIKNTIFRMLSGITLSETWINEERAAINNALSKLKNNCYVIDTCLNVSKLEQDINSSLSRLYKLVDTQQRGYNVPNQTAYGNQYIPNYGSPQPHMNMSPRSEPIFPGYHYQQPFQQQPFETPQPQFSVSKFIEYNNLLSSSSLEELIKTKEKITQDHELDTFAKDNLLSYASTLIRLKENTETNKSNSKKKDEDDIHITLKKNYVMLLIATARAAYHGYDKDLDIKYNKKYANGDIKVINTKFKHEIMSLALSLERMIHERF